MNTKTLEGLAGAGTNMALLQTPFRVYKEARRRGDLATMERAMGYVSDFADKTEEYKAKADEGMEEDAREAKEKAKEEREKAIQRRKEEREKAEERMEESKSTDLKTSSGTDSVKAGGEGAAAGQDSPDPEQTDSDEAMMPVTYTKTGEAIRMQQGSGISIAI